MTIRAPLLPGNRARRPCLDDEADPYDREQLQRRILGALKDGPLEKWKLREVLQVGEHKITREIIALKKLKAIKWVGRGRRQAQWALASWQAPPATRHTTVGRNTALFPTKRSAPTESWWVTARTREDFRRKLEERVQETGSGFGPVPHSKR
jgi:hypothetical protein